MEYGAKAVITEKPICFSLAEADAMVGADHGFGRIAALQHRWSTFYHIYKRNSAPPLLKRQCDRNLGRLLRRCGGPAGVRGHRHQPPELRDRETAAHIR